MKSCSKRLKQLDSERELYNGLDFIFLSEGIFLVNIESKLSDFGKISCRAPQGSILGPLLFLIYVKDMPQAVRSTLPLYADASCTNTKK